MKGLFSIIIVGLASVVRGESLHLTIKGKIVASQVPVVYSNTRPDPPRKLEASDLHVSVFVVDTRYVCGYLSRLDGDICWVSLSDLVQTVRVEVSSFGFKKFVVNVPQIKKISNQEYSAEIGTVTLLPTALP